MKLPASAPTKADRISLFELSASDVGADYVGWLGDPEVNRFLEGRFHRHDIDTTRDFVERMVASPSDLFLGIHSDELGRHVGNIKLSSIDYRHRTGEIGIMIGDREAWGRGVARTAISLMCRIAGEALNLRRVTAGCYASNVGSERTFLRAGFSMEGRRPGHFLLDGRPEDLVLLAKAVG